MRTPKIYSLNTLIDFLNVNSPELNISKQPLFTGPLEADPWLSGFIEAEGSFQVRSTTSLRKHLHSKFECKLEISQAQTTHLGLSTLPFLQDIALFMSSSVKETRLTRKKPEYRVRAVNLQGNYRIRDYLLKFPLFGAKYLDFISWAQVLELFRNKAHKTIEGQSKISQIKLTMNSYRKVFI